MGSKSKVCTVLPYEVLLIRNHTFLCEIHSISVDWLASQGSYGFDMGLFCTNTMQPCDDSMGAMGPYHSHTMGIVWVFTK